MPRLKDQAEIDREASCRYLHLEVRQGGTVLIPVRGATLQSQTTATSSSPDFTVSVKPRGNEIWVELSARHGTPLGEVPDHKVTITTTTDGARYVRDLLVPVSPIAASAFGKDTNMGTANSPFRTLRQATLAAATGDTIVLRNAGGANAFEPKGSPPITVPAGVIVQGQVLAHDPTAGQMSTPTLLLMPLVLAGGATLDNLNLGEHLTVDTPDAQVVLNNTTAAGGVSVTARATHATLSIASGSIITTDKYNLNSSPLLVEAPDATVTITRSNVNHGEEMVALPVMSLKGSRSHLAISGASRIQAVSSAVAIAMDDAETVELDGLAGNDLKIIGRTDIFGQGDSQVTVKHAVFAVGVNGGGIVFKGSGQSAMIVEDSEFNETGIVQDNATSSVTVRRTKFDGFQYWGVHLVGGKLDLGTADVPGNNAFRSGMSTVADLPIPVALMVDAPVGACSITSSATTYEGGNPGPCQITGPTNKDTVVKGLWRITNEVVLYFY